MADDLKLKSARHTRELIHASYELAATCGRIADSLPDNVARERIWDCDERVRDALELFGELFVKVLPLVTCYLPIGQGNELRMHCDSFRLGVGRWLTAGEVTRDASRALVAVEKEFGPDPDRVPIDYYNYDANESRRLICLDKDELNATLAWARVIAGIYRCLAEKAIAIIGPPLPEFEFHLNDATVTYNGRIYSGVDVDAARALQLICNARGEPVGITSRFGTKPDRVISKLHEDLRELVGPITNRGYAFLPLNRACP